MEKMKLMSFQAETPALALKKAQEQCGEEALVINTKLIHSKTLTTPALYEVIVAIENETKQKPQSPKPQQYQSSEMKEKERAKEDVVFSISAVAKQMNAIEKLSEASKNVIAPMRREQATEAQDDSKPS